MTESPKALQAFEDYWALGDDRSLTKLAAAYAGRTEGVPTRQVSRLKEWSQQHDWQQRVVDRQKEIAAGVAAGVVAEGIANRQNRIDALNDLWAKAHQVIAERAADKTMASVPGGKTGMLVRTYKSIGSGESATMMTEYAWDRSLEAGIVNLQVTSAKELGQWVEKREQNGELIVREYVGIDLDSV